MKEETKSAEQWFAGEGIEKAWELFSRGRIGMQRKNLHPNDCMAFALFYAEMVKGAPLEASQPQPQWQNNYSKETLEKMQEDHRKFERLVLFGECDHYFAAVKGGFKPCEFCNQPHPTRPKQ